MTIAVRAGLTAAGLGMALLAGCGGGGDDADGFESQSAGKIVAATAKDMGELETMRLSGSLVSDGEGADLDVQLGSDGRCTGTVTAEGVDTEVRATGGQMWIRTGDEQWQVVPQEMKFFTTLCNIGDFVQAFTAEDVDFDKVGTDTVDGQPVVELSSDSADQTAPVFVLAEAPHYIVRIGRDGEDGTLTLSDFDEEFEVEAPAADEIAPE
jgi:hypothetical protein